MLFYSSFLALSSVFQFVRGSSKIVTTKIRMNRLSCPETFIIIGQYILSTAFLFLPNFFEQFFFKGLEIGQKRSGKNAFKVQEHFENFAYCNSGRLHYTLHNRTIFTHCEKCVVFRHYSSMLKSGKSAQLLRH